MTNVIRPTFGARPAPAEQDTPARHHVEPYGTANGYTVGLVRADDDRAGPALKVVVGLDDGDRVDTVAVMPPTLDGELVAEMVALGILRTLEIMEIAGSGPGVA